MSALHLVRLPVNLKALAAFAVASGASDDDGGYALHLALRQRFGAAGPQPFRFLPDMPAHRGGPQLLGYAGDAAGIDDLSALPPMDDRLGDVFAGPPMLRPMPEAWREGARFGFEVRVRPVVRFGGRTRAARAARPGAWLNKAGRAAQEMDAFVAACERAGEGVPVDRADVYLDWLRRQLAPGAEVEEAELRQFRRVRTRRARHAKAGEAPGRASAADAPPASDPQPGTVSAGRAQVEGPDALVAGTLAVRDPAAFARLLARGVGRHAAFGYGMLLLSPPGRAG